MSSATPAPAISPSTILLDLLRFQLTGEIITPDALVYDAVRTALSPRVDRHPLAIIQAVSAEDVAIAVSFARAHELPLAVRSGGHSAANHSMIDGGLTIDLSAMNRITIEPSTRTARVGAGATSGDVVAAAHAHGLALSTGDTASVGMGGLVTGGGIGFMVRRHGLTIDNLLSARVVTADGAVVTASSDSHPDLFWAIRGGGGNVGIVTEFTFRLAPAGDILGGLLVLPATREVLRGYLDLSVAAPDDLTTIANLLNAPPLPFIPGALVGTPVLLMLATWTGTPEEGQRALAPFRALAEPIADLIGPMPYPAMYDFTAEQSQPHDASIRMMFADGLGDGSLDAMLAALGRASSPMSVVQLRGLGGAMARVDRGATAFAHRSQRYFMAILNVFPIGMDAAPHRAWTEGLWDTVRHDGSGTFVSFLEDEGEARIRDAFPEATYRRLQAVKRRYDPDNLFRSNQNVPPSA